MKLRALARLLTLASLLLLSALLLAWERTRDTRHRAKEAVQGLHGGLEIRKAGETEWQPAKRGTRLEPGDQIRARRGDLRIERSNGEIEVLPNGTIVDFGEYGPKPTPTRVPEFPRDSHGSCG